MPMYITRYPYGYVIKEDWKEDGKWRNRHIVALGRTSDPALALAAMKRRRARLKRRLAGLSPRAVKGRERLAKTIARLALRIDKVEMYLGGHRLWVITPCGGTLYWRPEAEK